MAEPTEKLWLVEVSRLVTEYGEVVVQATTEDEAMEKADIRLKASEALARVEWCDRDVERCYAEKAQEVKESEGYAADIE